MIHEDRKISEGWEDPAQLLAHPDNPKIHPMGQTAAVKAAIRELGWMAKIKVNTRTGYVIDGHDRIKAMMQEGVEQVPVEYYDLSPEEEKLFLVTYDPIGTMFASDRELTAKLLNDVNTGEEALQQFLSDQAEELGIVDYDSKAESLDAEPQISRADELREEWGVELGQVWRLPSRMEGQEHRIVCGDCTDREVVDSVMMGEKCDFVFTDPPYGQSYQSNMRTKTKQFSQIEGDAAVSSEFLPILEEVSSGWMLICTSWKVINQWFSEFSHLKMNNLIVWNKGGGGMGDLTHSLSTDYELIMAFGRGSEIEGKRIGSVWNVGKDAPSLYLHPTQKPSALIELSINTFGGSVLYEPFSGSGSTLIACENLSRQCRAVEISPAYVAVALQRYKDAFGITAELVKK